MKSFIIIMFASLLAGCGTVYQLPEAHSYIHAPTPKVEPVPVVVRIEVIKTEGKEDVKEDIPPKVTKVTVKKMCYNKMNDTLMKWKPVDKKPYASEGDVAGYMGAIRDSYNDLVETIDKYKAGNVTCR